MGDWFLLLSGAAFLLGTSRVILPLIKKKRKSVEGADCPDTETFRKRVPLKDVVARCEARWFLEDLKRAMDGESGAMIRVGHMLLAGYGVKQDKQEAGKWLQQCWAIQNYQNLVGMEIMDMDKSVVPSLSWRDASKRTSRGSQQVPEQGDREQKSIEEIYNLFEDTLKERRIVDEDFSKEVKTALVRQKWFQAAATAAVAAQQTAS